MVTRELRHAIARAVAAAGYPRATDPGLRPAGAPGRYAASVALSLGANPREAAETIAVSLAREPWIATAEVTGPGFVTVTVTPGALAAVADNVTEAGPACVTSDALAGRTVPAAPAGDPLAAPTWEAARSALAARLTVRLAAAAGATVTDIRDPERVRVPREALPDAGTGPARSRGGRGGHGGASPREATAYAGRDAVTFTLARAVPGKMLRVDPEQIARHVLGNPAYAVRYAHARAASGMRWAAVSPAADTIGVAEASVLLDALSWLPERVATAARRGRPDEFARYLEDLASVTVDVLTSDREARSGKMYAAQGAGSNPSGADEASPSFGEAEGGAPGRESPSWPAGRVQRLSLAKAARTGLAAGLSLLEVGAPERLLAER